MRIPYRRPIAAVRTAAALLGACAFLAGFAPQQEDPPMSDARLKAECEKIWADLRKAFEEYRLEDIRKMIDVPEGTPVPTRAQARDFAASLPDLSRERFLRIAKDGEWIGYYAQTDLQEKESTTVTVIRFQKTEKGLKLATTPHTISSFATDRALDAAEILKLSQTEEALQLRPSVPREAPARPAPPPEQDARPEAEIRKELEGIWRAIRDAFAAGKPEKASDFLLYIDGAAPPAADDARRIAREDLPDLVRGQFLKLDWSRKKPHLVGYIAEIRVGNAKISTVALIVFVRKEGAWKFAPGPASIEIVEVPKASRAKLMELIEKDPRLRL